MFSILINLRKTLLKKIKLIIIDFDSKNHETQLRGCNQFLNLKIF